MRFYFSQLFVFLSVILLAGCATKPPGIDVHTAITALQKDLVIKGVIPVSNYQDWSFDQKNQFAYDITREQCVQKTADPLVPVVSGEMSLGLSGSFTQSGNFQVNASPSGIPGFSFSGSGTKSAVQTINLPIQFVPVSVVPDVEMQVSSYRSGNILSQNSSSRDERIAEILSERAAFKQYLVGIVSRYRPNLCPTTDTGIGTNAHPLMGARLSDIKKK